MPGSIRFKDGSVIETLEANGAIRSPRAEERMVLFDMGWGCYLVEPETKEPIQFEEKHDIKGGMYALGGTTEAYISVTSNYYTIFKGALGGGLREVFDGKVASDTIPVLQAGIEMLIDDPEPCSYWTSSEGNAKKALQGMLALAEMAPHGIWDIC